MDEKELTRKLEHVDVPQIELPAARARLRRELLNSPDFERRSAPRGRFFTFRYALAGLVTLAVVFVVGIQMVPKRSSAEALIASMGSAYESYIVPGAVHYLRHMLRLPGDRDFEVETWLFGDERKFRARVKDADSGELIGHSIIQGDQAFGLVGSPVHVVGKLAGPAASPASPSHHRRMMTVVINRIDATDDWTDETVVRALVISDAFDRGRFTARTPQDLVRELAEGPEVLYAGAAFDSELKREVEILERHNSGALPFALEFPMRQMDKVQWFLGKVISREITIELGSDLSEALEESDLSSDIKIRPVESVETIEVFSDSKQIHQMTLTISQDGVETYRAEMTYLEDRYLSYEPDMFDPDHHGLEPVSHLNQESNDGSGDRVQVNQRTRSKD